MTKEYTKIGDKKNINGVYYYSPGYYDDGVSFGRIFKDEEAFDNDEKAICYIPEYGFTDAEPILIDGEEYYKEDDICAYSRATLQALLYDEEGNGYTDADGDELSIDAFFSILCWAFPQTYLNEMS